MTAKSHNFHQEGYIQHKRSLYCKLFKTIMIGFSFAALVELAQAFHVNNSLILLPIVFMVTSIVIFYITKQILKLEKCQELIITIFLLFNNSACIFIFYLWDPVTYSNIHNTFHCGYINALFEAAMTNRIPSFTYRTSFRIILLLIRFIIVPIDDKRVIPNQIICCICSIYLDYDKEKHDQNLYESYFNSKEKLNKFKDLVVNDIPEGVVVMTQDFTKCLFANNSFIRLAGESFSNTDFSTSLNKFKIYDVTSSNSDIATKDSLGLGEADSKETLLSFLQNLKVNGKFLSQKASCNLSFNKSNSSQDLSEYVFEAKIMPLIWDDYQAICITFHDVTQQNTIIRLKIAANQQKDRILATVSHELRTPLNGILGMIQVVQQKIQDTEILQYLSICSNSGYLLLGLVNSILDLNLIRANKLKLNTEKINVPQFLQEILQLFEYQCQTKSIFLRTKLKPNLSNYIVTDKNRLSQILINLIGNALKFTSTGGITVSAKDYSKNTDYMMISVEDTGMGIKEDKGKLFKIFCKLETETRVNTQGVGLGLTISNDLAKLLCGQMYQQGINLQSEFGKGSKFSFLIKKDLTLTTLTVPNRLQKLERQDHSSTDLSASFLNEGRCGFLPQSSPKKTIISSPMLSGRNSPLLSSHRSVQTTASSTKVSKYFTFSQENKSSQDPCVLIVDDNPLNIAVAKAFVLKNNYQVKTALSGQAAIDTMLENNHTLSPIKLVLMDLQMPMMDGYQATKALKELMKSNEVPETPIIALTANDNEDDKKACRKAGMCDYLSKPVKESEIAQILAKDYI